MCFRNEPVGLSQATTAPHTFKKTNSQRLSFAFAFVSNREKILNPGVSLFFTCKVVIWENVGFSHFFGKGPDCVADPFGTVPRRCFLFFLAGEEEKDV